MGRSLNKKETYVVAYTDVLGRPREKEIVTTSTQRAEQAVQTNSNPKLIKYSTRKYYGN